MSCDGTCLQPNCNNAEEPPTLPTDSAARKDTPLVRGVLDYFPAALAEVARLSKAGNDKHNPGEEMHHARGKSTDHADCIARHLVDRGTVDPEDGIRHSVKVAWRALALLQEELEAAGEAPLARGARVPDEVELEAARKRYADTLDERLSELACPAFSVETSANGTRFRRTGEVRPPAKGECYLSSHYDYNPVRALSNHAAHELGTPQIIVTLEDE